MSVSGAIRPWRETGVIEALDLQDGSSDVCSA